MTVEEFMREAQEYYGPYNPGVKKYVVKWFSSKMLSDSKIGVIWAETLKTCSSSYKTPPDVAVLEKSYKAMLDRDEYKPELQEYRLPQIEESAVPREQAIKFLDALVGALRSGRDPRQDPEVNRLAISDEDLF